MNKSNYISNKSNNFRKPKGPSVLTAKGLIEQTLPKDKKERELLIIEKFCEVYSTKKGCNLRIVQQREKPDFKCNLNDQDLYIEICELIHKDQLEINSYALNFEKYLKKEFIKKHGYPFNLCIEIICFNLNPKNIPNVENKSGKKIISELIEDIGNKLSLCEKLHPGKWNYSVWKKHQCHFEIRITKLPFRFPIPKESGIKVILTGINTIDSKIHNKLLINRVQKKNITDYSDVPDESHFWLVVWSYRHFPLDLKDESVQKLVSILKKTNACQFNQIWYFWPDPVGNGILLKLWTEQ